MTYQIRRNHEAVARLASLPDAPDGETYVVVTLAHDSSQETLKTSQDVLAWVKRNAEDPQVALPVQPDPSDPASAIPSLLLTQLALVGPMPKRLAGNSLGLATMRLQLVRGLLPVVGLLMADAADYGDDAAAFTPPRRPGGGPAN